MSDPAPPSATSALPRGAPPVPGQAEGPLPFVPRALPDGGFAWDYRVDPAHFNTHGTLHGGVLMMLIDHAMGHVVAAEVAPHGRINAAAQLNTHFLLPVRAGTLTCVARIVKLGRRQAVVEGTVTDEAGRTIAFATATQTLLP